jgi:hypothetical protein
VRVCTTILVYAQTRRSSWCARCARFGSGSWTAKAAHFGDVLGYAVRRFFPRRGVPSKLLYDALPPDAEVLPCARGEGYSEL